MFTMIVRLVAGAAFAVWSARSLSRLADFGAQEAFGPFDSSVLRWTIFGLGIVVGIIWTLDWSGVLAPAKRA